MEKKKYPVGAEHYELYEEIGQGVSASVFRAMCIPNKEIVAVKVLDFERSNSDLNNISREAQTMILVDHPNVLKSHCSFVNDHNLWVVMPFMPGGSCLHILKSCHPEGFEEVVIATILRETLKALEYLHHHGHIHRDVKAGNILICDTGAIKLGDLGVSACLFDSGDRQRLRNTFVGTPCWMAPEVMEQLHGYDFKADIWSFGITALELAHGHAPFSKYPPMKVLLMTLQNAPPGLDYERDKKFSKSFKQMIASCLVKDPSKRPSAKKLLKHSFFRQARTNDFIARKLLEGLPTLGDRLQALKRKEEDMLVQKKIPDGQKEEMSQNEYKRGISGWNFDLEDMKAQASLIQDEDPILDKDILGKSITINGTGVGETDFQNQLSYMNKASTSTDVGFVPTVNSIATSSIGKCEPGDSSGIASSSNGHATLRTSSLKINSEITGKVLNGIASHSVKRIASSGSIVTMEGCNGSQSLQLTEGSTSESMPKVSSKATLTNDEQDEKAKCHVVQQKGRFKVTSENADSDKVVASPGMLKSPSMRIIIEHPTGPQQGDATDQTNNPQRNGILGSKPLSADDITRLEKSKLEAVDDREKELLDEISELQRRLLYAQEELQKYKAGISHA